MFVLNIININIMNAQDKNPLSAKEQAIVTIAAFTANGDLTQLKTALNAGLDAGLTINEIKEELVQLYAYCGFPRSLNGINTFMRVLEDRRARGVDDEIGVEPAKVTGDNKYEQGRKTLEELTGRPESGPLTGANAFAPGIDTFLKEHLFADIFGRGVLSYQQRELATVSALATVPGLEAQLQAHIFMGMQTGLTVQQLHNVFGILQKKVSKTQGEAAAALLDAMRKTTY